MPDQYRKTKNFNYDIKHRAGKKIPHKDSLSQKNPEDDEQTALVNAIAMYKQQDNTDFGSRRWQLDKLQRQKLRDSQQNDKLFKEVYSWVLNKKKILESRHMKNVAIKELRKYWVQYTNLWLIERILYREHQLELKFETF